MKQTTLSEKAETTIDTVNQTAALLLRQLKAGEINKTVADAAIIKAQKKVKSFRKSYFNLSLTVSINEQRQFNDSSLYGDLELAVGRFNKTLEHFAEAVGAEFQSAKT